MHRLNKNQSQPSEPIGTLAETNAPIPEASSDGRFFQRTDWLSFVLATLLVLAGYLFTLAPDVTFDKSGIYSTGAQYAGVSHPSGFPLWTIYSWLFVKLLPFSNVAWRAAVAAAVAGALGCGII